MMANDLDQQEIPKANLEKGLFDVIQKTYLDFLRIEKYLDALSSRLQSANQPGEISSATLGKIAKELSIPLDANNPHFQQLSRDFQDFYNAILNLQSHLHQKLNETRTEDPRFLQEFLDTAKGSSPMSLDPSLLACSLLAQLVSFDSEIISQIVRTATRLRLYLDIKDNAASLMTTFISKMIGKTPVALQPNSTVQKLTLFKILNLSQNTLDALLKKSRLNLEAIVSKLQALPVTSKTSESIERLESVIKTSRSLYQGVLPNWDPTIGLHEILDEVLAHPYPIPLSQEENNRLSHLESHVRKPALERILNTLTTGSNILGLEENLALLDKIRLIYAYNHVNYSHYFRDKLHLLQIFYRQSQQLMTRALNNKVSVHEASEIASLYSSELFTTPPIFQPPKGLTGAELRAFNKVQETLAKLKENYYHILEIIHKHETQRQEAKSQDLLVTTLGDILQNKGQVSMGVGVKKPDRTFEHKSYEPLDPEDLAVIAEESEAIKQIMGPNGQGLPFSPRNLIEAVKGSFPWIDYPPQLSGSDELNLLYLDYKDLPANVQKAVMDLVFISVDNIGKLSGMNGMSSLVNLGKIDNIIINLEAISDGIGTLDTQDPIAIQNFIKMLNTVRDHCTQDNSMYIKSILLGQQPDDCLVGENFPVNSFLHHGEEAMHQLIQSVSPETIVRPLPEGSALPRPIAELLEEIMRQEQATPSMSDESQETQRPSAVRIDRIPDDEYTLSNLFEESGSKKQKDEPSEPFDPTSKPQG